MLLDLKGPEVVFSGKWTVYHPAPATDSCTVHVEDTFYCLIKTVEFPWVTLLHYKVIIFIYAVTDLVLYCKAARGKDASAG